MPGITVPKWALRLSKDAFKEWKSQQHDHILFFDGALQSNPEESSAGGDNHIS
jgi:hypothetical protein